MTEHIDMHSDLFRSDPNISPLFGLIHQTRREKFSEWCTGLYWHFRELSGVFKEDPPSRQGFLSMMNTHVGEHEGWYYR